MRKNKIFKLITIALVLIFTLSACTTDTPILDSPEESAKLEEQIVEKDAKIGELEIKIKEQEELIKEFEVEVEPNETPPTPTSSNLIITAINTLQIIKDKDFIALSSVVHPTEGVRFTPYEYIDLQNDKSFTPTEVAALGTDSQVYNWGSYDGTGNPIDFDFNGYYEEFIYDEDFMNPHIIGNNVAIGSGNSINNIDTEYPNGQFVEFHFTGFDPQYEGMDWSSLRLVFEEVSGTWYLVGIIHGQWTI